MKYNKIVKENDYNKSSFLITCVCSIVLLLTLCYFGVNGGVKGTYSLYVYEDQSKCAVLPSDYSSSNSSCPTGFTLNSQGKKCVKTYVIGTNNTEQEIRDECSSYSGSIFNIVGNQASCSVDVVCKSGATGGTGKCCPSGYTYGDKGYCVKSGYTLIQNPGGVADELGNDIISNLVCRTGSGTGTGTGEKACYFCGSSSSNKTYIWGEKATYDNNASCILKSQYTDETSCKSANGSSTATYTVTYNSNGGVGGPNPQTKNKGATLTLSTNTPVRTNYKFVNWNTKKDGSGASYNPGGKYSADATVTLFAQWAEREKCYLCTSGGSVRNFVWGVPSVYDSQCTVQSQYTDEDECDSANSSSTYYYIKYDANGGTGGPSQSNNITKGSTVTISSTKPTRTNYKFVNWNTKKDGSGTSYATGATYVANANLTLYAQWESSDSDLPGSDPKPGGTGGTGGSETVTYKATFDANNGKLEGSSTSTCTANKGESCTIPTLPTAIRNGYTFEGWGTNKSCTSGTKNSVTLSSNTTFYACWQKTGGDGNATENPPTGQTTTIAIIWFFGLLAIGYAFYYFKQVRGN